MRRDVTRDSWYSTESSSWTRLACRARKILSECTRQATNKANQAKGLLDLEDWVTQIEVEEKEERECPAWCLFKLVEFNPPELDIVASNTSVDRGSDNDAIKIAVPDLPSGLRNSSRHEKV